jgi:hypothetical protein
MDNSETTTTSQTYVDKVSVTVPFDGYYLVSGQIQYYNSWSGGGKYTFTALNINGTLIDEYHIDGIGDGIYQAKGLNSQSFNNICGLTTSLYITSNLSAGNTIKWQYRTDNASSGGAINTRLYIIKIA